MNQSFLSLPQSLLFAFLITTISIKLLKPIAPKYGLMDIQNYRKNHTGEIPLIGGIAMYFGIVVGAFFLLPKTWVSMTWLFTAAGVVILGVWDDAKDLPVKFRLIIQAIMTLILSLGSGYYLMNFGDIFGLGAIDLDIIGYLITPLAVIGAINAFNMMDGIDGLAGMMALVSFSALAILFWLGADTYGFYVSCTLLIVILPYLANNLMVPPFKNKIFMGDAGAMLIGFSVVWLLIYGSQSIPSGSEISFKPVIALYIIAVPLIDMVTIMIRRIVRKKSPFMADRDHLHHVLLYTGFSARQTLLIISCLATLIAFLGLIGSLFLVSEFFMFCLFVLLFVIYNFFIQYAWKFPKYINKNN